MPLIATDQPSMPWSARNRPATASASASTMQVASKCSEMAALLARVLDGRYRVEVPEEGALAVVAWLTHRGTYDKALEVIEAIAPFLERLRFTPREAETALAAGLSEFREPVRAVPDPLSPRS